jgi:DNA-binding IclR family transcriptional regulator
MLLALGREGLIEQEAHTRLYLLGPEIYVLGTLVGERYGIHTLAQPALRWLAEISEDTVFLSVVRGHELVCMLREDGAYPIKTHLMKVGGRNPLGIGAAGQAVLAALNDRQIEEVLAENADAIKKQYPRYSPRLLRTLVDAGRRNGFSVDEGLTWPGACTIGIAVLGPVGVPIAALSISSIELRMTRTRQKELAVHMQREAKWLTEQFSKDRGSKNRSRAGSVAKAIASQ